MEMNHKDIVVVGAGISGILAAKTAEPHPKLPGTI